MSDEGESPSPSKSTMEARVLDFIAALRRADLRVSPAESLDAFAAIEARTRNKLRGHGAFFCCDFRPRKFRLAAHSGRHSARADCENTSSACLCGDDSFRDRKFGAANSISECRPAGRL